MSSMTPSQGMTRRRAIRQSQERQTQEVKPRRRPRKRQSTATMTEAMILLQECRKGFISLARKVAIQIAMNRGDRTITIDDVREQCPPPGNIDPRVMGAVFSEPDVWEFVGFERSARTVCHKRPISRFRLKGYAGA